MVVIIRVGEVFKVIEIGVGVEGIGQGRWGVVRGRDGLLDEFVLSWVRLGGKQMRRS